MRVADLAEHKVMAEGGEISAETADIINRAKAENRRVVARGPTPTPGL